MKQEKKKAKKTEVPTASERTGYVTAVGTQVGKESSDMYIEIDNIRIYFDKKKRVTIKVEK